MSDEPVCRLKEFKGTQLRKARHFRALDVAELAEAVGITQRLLADYESGIKLPPIEHLLAFVRVLQFPPLHFCMEPKIKVEVIGNTYGHHQRMREW